MHNFESFHVVLWRILGIDIDTGIGWLDGVLGIATLVIAIGGIGWLISRRSGKQPPKSEMRRSAQGKNSN